MCKQTVEFPFFPRWIIVLFFVIVGMMVIFFVMLDTRDKLRLLLLKGWQPNAVNVEIYEFFFLLELTNGR